MSSTCSIESLVDQTCSMRRPKEDEQQGTAFSMLENALFTYFPFFLTATVVSLLLFL